MVQMPPVSSVRLFYDGLWAARWLAGAWDRYRERLARGRSELDDVGAIILRPVDHDPISTVGRHHCHRCFGGSLCTSSGHRSSITARIPSEMKSMRWYSRSSLCSRSKSADVMT